LQDFKPTFPKFEAKLPKIAKISVEGEHWMYSLLKTNPKKRLSIDDALKHRYLSRV
jgi:hypothetical protein